MGVTVRNVNGFIHIKHPAFKVTIPTQHLNVLERAISFAYALPVEDASDKPVRNSKRKTRQARKATPAPAPAVETAQAEVMEVKPAKAKAKAKAKKTPAPAPAPAPAPVPQSGEKLKVADVVGECLASGVTSRTEIARTLAERGFRPGPVAIYFTNQIEKGNLIVKGDTVSLPS